MVGNTSLLKSLAQDGQHMASEIKEDFKKCPSLVEGTSRKTEVALFLIIADSEAANFFHLLAIPERGG